jgi:lysine-specific demethylase 3
MLYVVHCNRNHNGADKVVVIECETEKIKQTSVGSFFESFKDPSQRGSKGVWKLKDWPSSQDFQSAYPDLYNDFCDSLPVPDFTRREGVLNLYAHVRLSLRTNGPELMTVPIWTY